MARGRPLGSKNKRKLPEGSPEPTSAPAIQNIQCTYCGTTKAATSFYMNKWSPLYTYTGKRIPICKDCIGALYQSWVGQFGMDAAIEIVCHYLDIDYDKAYIASTVVDGDFKIGELVKTQSLVKRKFATYIDTIANRQGDRSGLDDGADETTGPRAVKWKREDKKNREYAISVIGYNPYDGDHLSDADKIHGYNVLAQYCDNEGVAEDAHKIQCIIQIANMHIQCKHIDERIFTEYQSLSPNHNLITTLSKTKDGLLGSISKISKDNEIASLYVKGSKPGKNTLTQKMREMDDLKFWPSKQNVFDSKTCEAMRQIADLSHQSILAQLGPDDNDYVQMLKDQRELVMKIQRERDEFEELYRNAANELADLKNAPRRKGA